MSGCYSGKIVIVNGTACSAFAEDCKSTPARECGFNQVVNNLISLVWKRFLIISFYIVLQ